MVRRSWRLNSSGVASFFEDFCRSVAFVTITAQVSGSGPVLKAAPLVRVRSLSHGSFCTYVDRRSQVSPAIGAAAFSVSSDSHLSPLFTPFSGNTAAIANRETHSAQT